MDPVHSVADSEPNCTTEVTSPSLHSQEVEERDKHSISDSPKPKPVPRPRKGLHQQNNIDGSVEMDVKKTDKREEEEGEEAESASIQDSPSQSLSSRANVQSLESLDSMGDADRPRESPLPSLRRGQVLKGRSHSASIQSSNRSSAVQLSADRGSITSEDRSRSETSSAEHVPAPELTRALVSAFSYVCWCQQWFVLV